MHTIQINDDTYTLPESWDELTPKQLLYLVKLTKSDIPDALLPESSCMPA